MTALLVLSNGLVTFLLKSSRRPYRDVTLHGLHPSALVICQLNFGLLPHPCQCENKPFFDCHFKLPVAMTMGNPLSSLCASGISCFSEYSNTSGGDLKNWTNWSTQHSTSNTDWYVARAPHPCQPLITHQIPRWRPQLETQKRPLETRFLRSTRG